MAEIQKADPKARRTSLAIVGGGALLGVVLLTIAGARRPQLEAWVGHDVRIRGRIVVAALALLTAGPALGLAAYLWHLGQRIVRAGRFPPPGLSVVRDTVVVVGQPAARRGRLMQACGALVALATLLMVFFLWRLLFLLERGPA